MKKKLFYVALATLFASSTSFAQNNNIIFSCETKVGQMLTIQKEDNNYILQLNGKVLAKNKENDVLKNTADYGSIATLGIVKKAESEYIKKYPEGDFFDGDESLPETFVFRGEAYPSDLMPDVKINELKTMNKYQFSFADSKSIYVLMAFSDDEVIDNQGQKYAKILSGFVAKTKKTIESFPQKGSELGFCKNNSYAKIGFNLNKTEMNDEYKKFLKTKPKMVNISSNF